MKNLNKTYAFNPAYRENWRQYLRSYSDDEISKKLNMLCGNLDPLSQLSCQFQLEMVPYAFPHPILSEMFHAEGLESRITPHPIIESLKAFGIFGEEEDELAKKIQKELGLPEPVLHEFLVGCGLDYIRSDARKKIKKRTVIDAGAYIGDSARFFQLRYGATRVFAIEPDMQNYVNLGMLVDKLGAKDVIVPIQAATGKEAGYISLW